MQLLDETPAILLLHKLCSEHVFSYEWKNCETPRLTPNGKTNICTMDNFVPLVVPGLSSSSSSRSASTSRPKDQSNSPGDSETSSDPVTTRSDKRACGKPMQTDRDKLNRGQAHKKNEMNKEDPMQGIPDWLQPFTANLEDLETHVPAHSSEREISDSLQKVETQKTEAQYLYSLLQRPKLRHMLENQNYEGSLQKTHWRSRTSCRKCW